MRKWIWLLALPALALDNGVTVYNATAVAQTAQPRTIHRVFAKGDFPAGSFPKPRVGGVAASQWQVDIETTWPDGSVQFAFISLPLSIGASGSVYVDFVKDGNACHLGSLATCQAAALTQQQMLDFDAGGGAGSWSAKLSGKAGSVTNSAAARTMLAAGAWTYRLRGPVVTQIKVEDVTRPDPLYDFGWEYDFAANTANQLNAVGAFQATRGTHMGLQVKWTSPTAITAGNPTVFTMAGHGLTAGQSVWFRGFSGNWAGMNGLKTVAVTGADTFTVDVDSTAFGSVSASSVAVVPPNFNVGIGDSNSLTPQNGAGLKLVWPNLLLWVRTGGVESTYSLWSADSTLERYLEMGSDAGQAGAKMWFRWDGARRSVCASGCDFTVPAGWFATAFTAIRKSEDAGGNAVPTGSMLLRMDGWKTPTNNKYKSVHPIFVLAFHPGWAGVEVETIAENPWMTKFQRQVFDLEIRTGAGESTLAYGQYPFELPRGSGFRKLLWSGSAPGEVVIDHNLKYLISTRIIPAYDYKQRVAVGTITGWLSEYNSVIGSEDTQSASHPSRGGNFVRDMKATGGRPDLGLLPDIYAGYLFAMGDTASFPSASASVAGSRHDIYTKLLLGNADVSYTASYRLRESDTTAGARNVPADGFRYYFDYPDDATTPAFGRIMSLSGRPQYFNSYRESLDGNVKDRVTPVCSAFPCYGTNSRNQLMDKQWIFDAAHLPSAFFIPWLLTGRYGYQLAQQELAPAMVSVFNAGWGNRLDSWALFDAYENWRAIAWTMRELFFSALVSPDGSPERGALARVLERNDEHLEGKLNVVGGNAQALSTPGYCAAGVANGTKTAESKSDYATDSSGTFYMRPNGYVRTFATYDPIYSVQSVTVNGVAQSVGVYGVDTGKAWYYYRNGFVVIQDPAAAALQSTDVIRISYTAASALKDPWCVGRHRGMKSTPNPLGMFLWRYAYGDSNPSGGMVVGARQYTPYMHHYNMMVYRWVETSGAFLSSKTGQPLMKFTNKAIAQWVLGSALNPASNMFWQDAYVLPAQMRTYAPAGNWSEFASNLVLTAPLDQPITAASTSATLAVELNTAAQIYMEGPPNEWSAAVWRIENEWVQICSWSVPSAGKTTLNFCAGGRGLHGSTATSHAAGVMVVKDRQQWKYTAVGHTYSNLALDTIAWHEDQSVTEGSGRRAWEKASQTISYLQNRGASPGWMFVPRDRITEVRPAPVAGQLRLSWTAPSPTACRVYAGGTEPAGSDDSGDSLATVISREQRFNWSGPSGTVYYRITCGTARVSGTATIP